MSNASPSRRPATATPPGGLRPGERARHAQRHAAGARAHAHRPSPDAFCDVSRADRGQHAPTAGRAPPDQTLLIQAHDRGADGPASPGRPHHRFDDTVAATFAWTARFAEQVDAGRLRSQPGAPVRQAVARLGRPAGRRGREPSRPPIGARTALASRPTLTSPFGIADFVSRSGDMPCAWRAVAVARPPAAPTTRPGRARAPERPGPSRRSLLTGRRLLRAIGNLHPGDADYAAAARRRLCPAVRRPAARRAGLRHLRAGRDRRRRCRRPDRHAADQPTTGDVFYAFAHANERNGRIRPPVNYGHNTWGCEDTTAAATTTSTTWSCSSTSPVPPGTVAGPRPSTMPTTPLPNSTFLDFTSHGMTTATNVVEAYGLGGNVPATAARLSTLRLSLDAGERSRRRCSAAIGGTRQKQLDTAQRQWHPVVDLRRRRDALHRCRQRAQLAGHPTILGDADGAGGYVTSAEARTVWVSLTPNPVRGTSSAGRSITPISKGYDTPLLGRPRCRCRMALDVKGLWFDSLTPVWGTYPAVSAPSSGAAAPVGPWASKHRQMRSSTALRRRPATIARWFYNFPLTGGLDCSDGNDRPRSNRPSAIPLPGGHTSDFSGAIEHLSPRHGHMSPGEFYVVANNGQSYTFGAANPRRTVARRRCRDIGQPPHSTMGLYVGSGIFGDATSNAYTAYQSAFWDTARTIRRSCPRPPASFSSVRAELAVRVRCPGTFRRCAALRNISTFIANNDWGSSYNSRQRPREPESDAELALCHPGRRHVC